MIPTCSAASWNSSRRSSSRQDAEKALRVTSLSPTQVLHPPNPPIAWQSISHFTRPPTHCYAIVYRDASCFKLPRPAPTHVLYPPDPPIAWQSISRDASFPELRSHIVS